MTIFKPVLRLLLSFTYHWGIKPLQQAQMVERLPSQSSPQQHQCVCNWQTSIYCSFLSQQHPLVACRNVHTAIVIQDNPCEKKNRGDNINCLHICVPQSAGKVHTACFVCTVVQQQQNGAWWHDIISSVAMRHWDVSVTATKCRLQPHADLCEHGYLYVPIRGRTLAI